MIKLDQLPSSLRCAPRASRHRLRENESTALLDGNVRPSIGKAARYTHFAKWV